MIHSESISVTLWLIIESSMTDSRSGFKWVPASGRLLIGFWATSRGFPEARNMTLVICQDGSAADPSGTTMTRIRGRGVEVVPVG